MDFLNRQVHAVPDAAEIEFIPVERAYLKVMRLEWLITMVVIGLAIAALFYFQPRLQQPLRITVGISLWVMIALIWYLSTEPQFSSKAYALREHDITYRSGWIIKTIRTSPFSRIQHSNISSGPLERKFGLASLIIYTAGSGGADTKIPGLKESVAHDIKDWLNKRVSDEAGTGE